MLSAQWSFIPSALFCYVYYYLQIKEKTIMINHKDYTYEEFMRIGAYQCAFRQLACEAVPYRNINLLMSAFNDPVSSRLSLVAWYDYLPEIEKEQKE